MVDITITTPTIRPEMMEIVSKSIARQTFKNFEWLVGAPAHLEEKFKQVINIPFTFVAEPPKKSGDFYSLSKCWNSLFRKAQGKLIVNIVDGISFPPDVLQNFWDHFQANDRACVTTVGDQYAEVIDGKLSILVWQDPRGTIDDKGSFYETYFTEMELCLASIPRQAILDSKGLMEVYDQGAAMGEKVMCLYMERLGYKMYIDKSIRYQAIHHPRIGGSEEWDKHYKIACRLFDQHLAEIQQGKILKGDL